MSTKRFARIVTALLPLALGASALHARQEGRAAAREPGVSVRVYDVDETMDRMPFLVGGQTPNANVVLPGVNMVRHEDFLGFDERFIVHVDGFLNIDAPGEYALRLESDDGSFLFLGGEQVIDLDGVHGTLGMDVTRRFERGEHPFRITYFQNLGGKSLRFLWRPPGAEAFTVVPTSALTCQKGEVRVTSPGKKQVIPPLDVGAPGDRRPLEGIHPSYDHAVVHPASFQPRVGGMDWLSGGRLVICTWDPSGSVYVLDGVQGNDPEAVTVRRIASGLAEPLGLTVVDDRIFVLQKQELTELIDRDGDGVIDEYRCVCAGWPVSPNFHEFAFGLAYKDGHFYANLAIAIDPGGASTRPQVPERGSVLKIDPRAGTYQIVAHGLRTPNGIGIGVDDEVFITDNQGDWVPVSKLVHLTPGAFYGSRAVLEDEGAALEVADPVVWLPQGEIGNSPSEPTVLNDGPYAGQMLHGDVTHGGLKRVFIEKVGGAYQGCVFRFSQGLEAGVNRVSWGPDGALYIGGIGSTGNWGQEGKKRFGLERIKYNGTPTFEMLAVRAKSNGMEIEFTRPLASELGWDPTEYHAEQYRYEPTAQYGGPKLGQETLEVRSATVSPDRRRVFLEIDGLRPRHVVYLRLVGDFYSAEQTGLWSTEAWYTLNRIPQDDAGRVEKDPPVRRHNTLSDEEKAEGWTLLFDGASIDAWRGYRRQDLPEGWAVEEGCITRVGGGGDIVTKETFGSFELSIDWRIAPKGNSGIFFRVHEAEEYPWVWQTGVEMQVLDNALHADGVSPFTSAGACYALYEPRVDATRPVGTFNRARIVARGDHVEHWLNGVKLLEYRIGSDDWNQRIAKSKFASMPGFAKHAVGHIALQDHGDRVQYRNIKIRRLDGGEKGSGNRE